MKAVVFHGIGDIRYEDVANPKIQDPTDAVVDITATAICGTDLHMIRGSMPKVEPGTILGHEAVGVVREVGRDVRNLKPGDKVVIASSIACGYCAYCRDGYFSQCDNANPNGKRAGTAFFGGPKSSGGFQGLQAEQARVPYANVGLTRISEDMADSDAIFLSDIFPTGYFGADMAEIKSGDTVAVFGCGPVGQFAVASAKMLGAGRVFAVDRVPSRLEMARNQGAETVDFDREDPVETIVRLTGGIGVDRVIDAVGVDAEMPRSGPAKEKADRQAELFAEERREIAPETHPEGDNWKPGNAPTLALEWAVDVLAKAGTLSVIGVYPENVRFFPIGKAMNKNLTINLGNCPHKRYIPMLADYIETGAFDPSRVLTQVKSFSSIIDAYKAFDLHEPGWIKVELRPGRGSERTQ